MKYWLYARSEVPGCFDASVLAALPDFTEATLVCPAEGDIREKNWRPAAEFDEIATALAARAPLPPLTPPSGDMLDAVGQRLFARVSALMNELATRRESEAVVEGLKRRIASLKEELAVEKRRAEAAEAALDERARATESLSRRLAEKEFSLDKAVALLRRLDEKLEP